MAVWCADPSFFWIFPSERTQENDRNLKRSDVARMMGAELLTGFACHGKMGTQAVNVKLQTGEQRTYF